MQHLARALILASLTVPAWTTGCGDPADEAAVESGTLTMPLTAVTGNGASYELRNAMFTVSGPDDVTISSEDHLGEAVARTDLHVGDYDIELAAGWRLERTNGSTPGPVAAMLVSANPVAFSIADQGLTRVNFAFRTEGGVIELGTGTLEVGISVDDETPPQCGNGVVEAAEQCDDGNTNNGDGCTNDCRLPMAGPTAFRITSLALRDPHVFASVVGCRDITNPGSGVPSSFNGLLSDGINQDADGDGMLDLSQLLVFRPLDESAPGGVVEIASGLCTAPSASSVCHVEEPPVTAMYTNRASGLCLEVLPGSANNPMPPIQTTSGPCFAGGLTSLTLDFGSIALRLQNVSVAAKHAQGTGTLADGLLRGFLSETDANNTLLPANLPLIGGRPLSSLLGGGAGSCSTAPDRDFFNGVPGWWFYFNYSARVVPFGP